MSSGHVSAQIRQFSVKSPPKSENNPKKAPQQADKLEFGGVRRSTNAFPFGEGASEGGGRGVILQRKITLPKAINRYVVAENANKFARLYRTSPDLASLGHPPQRGGHE